MAQLFSRTFTVQRGLEEYEVECDFEVGSWGCAAQVSGPPESCYPAEGIEAWIVSATIDPPAWARDRYPYNALAFALTDAERWKLEEEFCNDPPEQDYGPDPDDYYDDRYERDRHPMEGDGW